jgi:hypothetical protein
MKMVRNQFLHLASAATALTPASWGVARPSLPPDDGYREGGRAAGPSRRRLSQRGT